MAAKFVLYVNEMEERITSKEMKFGERCCIPLDYRNKEGIKYVTSHGIHRKLKI
jgi:hypothetical protein